MTAEEEAKQLDSVTDRVAETELDTSRANQALGALGVSSSHNAKSSYSKTITVKKEDVDAIVELLEVSESEAGDALRAALEGDDSLDGEELVTDALRRLVTS